MNSKDMDVLEFARKISMLTLDTPISKQYDEKYGQKEGCWWSCQREHLTVWCLHQPTVGIQGFERNKPNYSARKMYYHFGRPETLLWLAEALGEEENKLLNIIKEIENLKNPRKACNVITREDCIPFERILFLIEKM